MIKSITTPFPILGLTQLGMRWLVELSVRVRPSDFLCCFYKRLFTITWDEFFSAKLANIPRGFVYKKRKTEFDVVEMD